MSDICQVVIIFGAFVKNYDVTEFMVRNLGASSQSFPLLWDVTINVYFDKTRRGNPPQRNFIPLYAAMH